MRKTRTRRRSSRTCSLLSLLNNCWMSSMHWTFDRSFLRRQPVRSLIFGYRGPGILARETSNRSPTTLTVIDPVRDQDLYLDIRLGPLFRVIEASIVTLTCRKWRVAKQVLQGGDSDIILSVLLFQPRRNQFRQLVGRPKTVGCSLLFKRSNNGVIIRDHWDYPEEELLQRPLCVGPAPHAQDHL